MVELTFKIEGLDMALESMEDMRTGLERLKEALAEVAAELVSDVVDSISTGYPPASAPFEPPHARTGNLRRSVRIHEIEETGFSVAAGGAGTLADYAAYLEFGTSRMEPRPFMIPAIERMLPRITEAIAEALIKRSG